MNAITLEYLISLSNYEGLWMNLMDVVVVYLYESLDNDIYIRFSKD